MNITSVWDTRKGTGIRIGIVDDGLQTTHPDLLTNVDTANDHDWNDGTPDDPNPVVTADFHGSSCAGVAAGRGNNSVGISGAAPEATLVGLRLIGAATTDTQESEAEGWKNDIIQVKTNSWGPNDDGKTLEGPGPITTAALAKCRANRPRRDSEQFFFGRAEMAAMSVTIQLRRLRQFDLYDCSRRGR